MFFLLRVAFWLGVVCVLLPTGGTNSPDNAVDPASAVSAASATLSDMRGFCERQPQACVVGGKVAASIGEKAEAGARTIYGFISAKLNEKSGGNSAERARPIAAAAQGTLTPADLTTTWHAPVPLPPRREARANRPSA